MGVKIRFKRNHVYLDIIWKGMRWWETTGLTVSQIPSENRRVMELAETIRSRTEVSLVCGEYDLPDPTAGRKLLTVYAEEQAAKQNEKNPLPKSLKYLIPFAGNVTLAAITPGLVDNYREYLLSFQHPTPDAFGKTARPLSPNTATKYLEALRTLLRQAVRDRLITKNPSEIVKGIKVSEPVTYALDIEELQKLAHTPVGGKLGGEIHKAFLFDCFCGLRISDLRALQWGDVIRKPLSLRITQQKTRSVVTVPLSPQAWALLDDKQIHRTDDCIFPLLAETKSNINQYLVAWAKDAGIGKPIGWHTARRTFGTLALQGGADLAVVGKLLGHTKLMNTQKYLRPDSSAARRAVENLQGITESNMNTNA
jgi:integrase